MMTKRAIWIIDEAFLVVALLSVRSFLDRIKVPVTIYYCGEEGLDQALIAFSEIDGEVEVLPWKPTEEKYNDDPTVRNRLARMTAVSNHQEDLLFLLDADIMFAPGFEELVSRIEGQKTGKAGVWGVPEQRIAWHNKFYFHRIDEKGKWQHLHPMQEQMIYREVYGPEWLQLLGSYNLNNGMLALYRCQSLGPVWKEYYLRGLEHSEVNSGDDQRPFAAAIQYLSIPCYLLPERFNSLGKVNGDFLAYHSYSGRWKMAVRGLAQGAKAMTGFSRIASHYWRDLSEDLRISFVNGLTDLKPQRFEGLPGALEFWWVYQQALKQYPDGHFVEVRSASAKGVSYLAESLSLKGLEGKVELVTGDDRRMSGQGNGEVLREQLKEVELLGEVVLVEKTSSEAALGYQGQSLDLVYLAGADSALTLMDDLATWLPKVKKGGILAGIDRSAGAALSLTEQAIAGAFCEQYGLTCQYQGQIFVIENVTFGLESFQRVSRGEGERIQGTVSEHSRERRLS